jgi:cell wall-associated NlpC family hydrolase
MNTTPYIGLPFADHGRDASGFDCWGLTRHVMQQEYGITLPDYGGRYTEARDRHAVADAITAGLIEGWHRVEHAVEGALVIFRIAGKPWHVGVMVDARRFLHVPPGETSCIERLASPMWEKRIEGFYVRG